MEHKPSGALNSTNSDQLELKANMVKQHLATHKWSKLPSRLKPVPALIFLNQGSELFCYICSILFHSSFVLFHFFVFSLSDVINDL